MRKRISIILFTSFLTVIIFVYTFKSKSQYHIMKFTGDFSITYIGNNLYDLFYLKNLLLFFANINVIFLAGSLILYYCTTKKDISRFIIC